MQFTDNAQNLALQLWQEASDHHSFGDHVCLDDLDDFIRNQTWDTDRLEEAANGDISAIAYIRQQMGLPIFC